MNKISIITVALNCAKTIERTIQSVLCQDYPLVEYIVVDGGSTDGTKEIIEKYADKIAWWVSEPDKGIYDAMNKALLHVTGDIVNFQGGDDYLIDQHVLAKVNKAMASGDCDVLVGTSNYGGRIWNTCPADFDSLLLLCTNHQAVFARTELFRRYGFFDTAYSILADYNWTVKVAAAGAKFKKLDEVVAYYSTDGWSSGIDVYRELGIIQSHWAKRTGREALLPRLEREWNKGAVGRIISTISKKLDADARALIKKEIGGGNNCGIWGWGVMGKECYSLLQFYGIAIDFVFDKRAIEINKNEDADVQIREYQPSCYNGFVIIAATKYEQEIKASLLADGRKHGRDFISYSDLKRNLVDMEMEKHHLIFG